MRVICMFALLWSLSKQSELFQLLSTADMFKDEFQLNQELNTDDLKLMLKRTYKLDDDRRVFRRSLDHEKVFIEEAGIYVLNDIVDVGTIPAKFPNDFNVFSSKLPYIVTLESNGSNPENHLSNNLVFYRYSPVHGIKEMGRISVLGGVRSAIHWFRNNLYIIVAEHDANVTSDSFEGSTLYKIVEEENSVALNKIQTFNVIEPNHVELWEHQEEFFLAIVSNPVNNSLDSGTLIYRWMGHHFDCIQHISSKFVKNVVPFWIGSFMYLAIANYQNEYGDTDIYSNIYRFHLDDLKFHLFQSIKTHGAQHIAYFRFEDVKLQKSEHFLAVANYIGKNSNGALTSFLESVIYKFTGNYFIPFQSFKLLGAIQWLPIKGLKGEFILLVSHSNGLRGYQYDGWRFNQVSLKFGQSALGENIQSMRSFIYQGDIFLTIADKISQGKDINLWQLSFKNNNVMMNQYNEIKEWCKIMISTLENDNITKDIDELPLETNHKSENRKLQVENLEGNEPLGVSLHEIESLINYAEQINENFRSIENGTGNQKSNDEIPLFIDSKMFPQFEIKCRIKNCVTFENLKILNLNGENFLGFLNNVVSMVNESLQFGIAFGNVSVENDVFAHLINGHPFGTLVDVTSETFVNSEFIVNGTIFINNNLNIYGSFDGVNPDKNHLLLFNQSQFLDSKLTLNVLKVDNLKFFGNLNRHFVQDLFQHPKMELHNTYEKLNVNNIVIDGFINEFCIQDFLKNVTQNLKNLEIQGDLDFDELEAQEVFVDSNEIFNISISESGLLSPCTTLSPSGTKLEDEAPVVRSIDSSSELLNSSSGEKKIIVVVEGILKAKDVLDFKNSNSLLTLINDTYNINETNIYSFLKFSNVSAKSIKINKMNEIPLESWILRNSSRVQEVEGKKIFSSNVHVESEIFAKQINAEYKKTFDDNLKKNEFVFGDWTFDIITCDTMITNFTNFGNRSLKKVESMIVKDSAVVNFLEVKSLTVKGKVDNVSWINFLEDSIFDSNDFVEGEKVLKGNFRVDNFNINGRINGIMVDELIQQNEDNSNVIILEDDVFLKDSLNVNELNFEGTIDSILKPRFKNEWILQDRDQIIKVPVQFENVELKAGSILKNETINNINLKKLFSRSLKVNEDTKIKYLYALNRIKVNVLDVEGTVNGADFKTSVIRSKSENRQDLSGNWLFEKDLIVNGSLVAENYVSGLNVSDLCKKNISKKINLIVGGMLRLKREPYVFQVNGINVYHKVKECWMKNENTTLRGPKMTFVEIAFENRATILGLLNNIDLAIVSRYYLSKTKNRVASGDFEFDDLIIRRWSRMRKANVNGTVNGINLNEWAKNVLLQEEDQTINERLTFNVFEAANVLLNGSVNKLNLLNDVLRYDVENVVIEGEKTFESIRVVNLTIKTGGKIQGIDVTKWQNDLVTSHGNFNFKGNIIIDRADFRSPVTVFGKVSGILFNSKHLLLKEKNQVVTGKKHFSFSDGSDVTLSIANLKFFGLIDNLDFNSLMKMQAYSDQNLVFAEPQTFTKGFNVNEIKIDGAFQGVNVSGVCHDLLYPIDVNKMEKKFKDLSETTETFIEIVTGAAFFFDYLESVQTLKPNVRAVLPTVDNKGHYLSVLTPNLMRFMHWNEYSESFVNSDESLALKDDITFVASTTTDENPFLYIESSDSVKIFKANQLQEIEGKDTSCIASFRLKALNKTCILIGYKYNSSRVLCSSTITGDLRTFQWLESKGSVQATTLTINNDVYLAVINREEIMDKFENSLIIYRFDPVLQHFYESHTLAVVNPVAVSSIFYRGTHYLVLAEGHLPESVHNSIISIFRFNKNHKVFVRSKSIQVDTPVDVQLALLPSEELALYVLTSNPTKPLVVYLHRGVAGFVEETSGLSLYPGSKLYSFTDFNNRHFVVISGFGRGQILKAGFKGERN